MTKPREGARKKAKSGEPLAWLCEAACAETDECLLWPFGGDNTGYGRIQLGDKLYRPHQLIALSEHGPRHNKRLDVMHSCDTRRCCNPRHLSYGTRLDNVMDMMRKKRHWSQRR